MAENIEIEILDDLDMALLIRATWDGEVKISSHLEPEKTVALLRDIANGIETRQVTPVDPHA